MRLTHDAIRHGLKELTDKAVAGDVSGAEATFGEIMAILEVHMKMEDLIFFPILNDLFDGVIAKELLGDEHLEDQKKTGALRKALADKEDVETVKRLAGEWAKSHEEHLEHEEKVMMPLTEKVAPTLELRGRAMNAILHADWDGFKSHQLGPVLKRIEASKPFGALKMIIQALQHSTTPAEYTSLIAIIKATLQQDNVSKLDGEGVLSDGTLPEHPAGWQELYGILGTFASKDPAAATKNLMTDARDQVLRESMAPSFTVFGSPTSVSEGYTEMPNAGDKICWHASFDKKEAWGHADHQERKMRKDQLGAMKATGVKGDMVEDMQGSYMGPLHHIEKQAPPAFSAQGLYSVVCVATATDPEAAKKLFEVVKGFGNDTSAIRFTVAPGGGDMPGADSEEALATVRWVECFLGRTDHEAHKGSDAFKEREAKVKEFAPEGYKAMEFANTCHFVGF